VESNRKIVGIVVGRMNSTRFPGKMEQLLCGIPLLQFVINRAEKALHPWPVIVATSINSPDDRINDIADRNNVECFRGDLLDVAGRVLNCALKYNADYFVRLNADSPMIDLQLISRGLQICQNTDYDLITNIHERSYPYGISMEIIKTSSFKTAYSKMNEIQREHVTSYLYQNSDKFNLLNIKSEIEFNKDLGFTVDFPLDLEKLNKLLDNDTSKTWRDFV